MERTNKKVGSQDGKTLVPKRTVLPEGRGGQQKLFSIHVFATTAAVLQGYSRTLV